MRRRMVLIALVLVALGVLGLAYYAVATFDLCALQQPGKFETYIAPKAKQWLVARAARGSITAPPPGAASDKASGQSLFSGCCGAAASCCGMDSRGGGTAPG